MDSKEFRLDTIESYSAIVKAARRVLKEFKRRCPKDIDMHKIRTGKTTYFFRSKERMHNKIKELEDYEYAPPGENFK